MIRFVAAVSLVVAGFGCSGSGGGEDAGADAGVDAGGSADAGSTCGLTGTWSATHVAAGGTTISVGLCADAHAFAFHRSGGSFPDAFAAGTYTYDASAGTIVITNSTSNSADPNFDGCVGVPGTYQLTFNGCSQLKLTLVNDACAVRVASMSNGGVLNKGPLPTGMDCTASGIEEQDGGTSAGTDGGSDGGTNDGGSMGSDGGTHCTVTLSGGLSKTITTCTVNGVYDGTNTSLSITTPAISSSVPELSFVAKIASVPMTGTAYGASNSVQQSGTIFESPMAIWSLDSAKGTGTSSVQFSEVKAGQSSGSNTLYTLHGTLTATYASSAANPAVTVDATF